MNLGKTAVVLLLACLCVAPAGAGQSSPGEPDLAREQRMAAEIVDAILDGEPIEIKTENGLSFLGIFTETAVLPVKGTVLILHGRGLHPNWPNVVHPLRVGLVEHGWNTLAIQLPVLAKDATYDDYFEVFDDAIPRIEAAIAFARAASGGKLVVLAHSCGTHMAQHWMHAHRDTAPAQFDGFVGIGMGAIDIGQAMREPFALDKLPVPVLDVYAELDFPNVQRLAPARREAMQRGGNALSAQIVVPDAEHYFVDRDQALLDVVAAWLDTL
ncbi:MAG: DUF3530 family protein [Sedimenticolaceae bacterium]